MDQEGDEPPQFDDDLGLDLEDADDAPGFTPAPPRAPPPAVAAPPRAVQPKPKSVVAKTPAPAAVEPGPPPAAAFDWGGFDQMAELQQQNAALLQQLDQLRAESKAPDAAAEVNEVAGGPAAAGQRIKDLARRNRDLTAKVGAQSARNEKLSRDLEAAHQGRWMDLMMMMMMMMANEERIRKKKT